MAVTKLSNSGIKTGIKKYDSMLAGNAAFDPAATWLIQRTTLSTNTTTVTFTSIPSTYQHLQVRIMQRSAGAGTGFASGRMRVNSDSGSNYTLHYLQGDGATATAYGEGNSTGSYTYASQTVPLDGNTASVFGVSIIDLHDYASTTKNKTFRGFHGLDRNGSGKVMLDSCVWRSTSAITTLAFTNGDGDWKTGTTFALYGFKGV